MLIFVLLLFSILIAWKWGDWQNWTLYYPTILYMILGDLAYIILSRDKLLWEYKSSIFTGDFAQALILFVVFPCTCLVFLPLYSKVKKRSRILYILLWAFIYISVEWLSFRLGFFTYHNGWNLYWSFGFDCLMFPLLILHYNKTLWVWPVSITLAFFMIYYFNLPFAILK